MARAHETTFRPGVPAALLGATVATVAAVFACQKIYDPDTWWHLATGRWIVEHRAVPTRDVFSFATSGAPWVAHSWLAEVVMEWIHGVGGPSALVLAKAAVVVVGFAVAFALTCRNGAAAETAALALALSVPIARFQFRERPHVFMFVLVPLFFGVLYREAAERRRSTWIVLGIAALAWTNLHGSFLLGPLIAGALVFERVLWRAFPTTISRGVDATGSVALAAGLFLAIAAAGLVSPFGTDLPLQMIRDFASFAVTRSFSIQEHQPLSPADYPAFVAVTAATAASFLVSGRRARPFAGAVFAGLSVLAFRSVRFASVAAQVDACVLALNVQPLVVRVGRARGTAGSRFSPVGRALAVSVAVAVGAALTARAVFHAGREARFGLGVNEDRFPVASVRFLANTGFEGNLFNSWVHGGFVLWNLPKARTLVDGRALPAHVELLERLAGMSAAELDRWLEDQDVRAALLERNDPWLPRFQASPRYVAAYFDDRAVAFLRRDGGRVGGYRFIRPDAFDPSYLSPLASGPQAPEVEAELRRALADAPASFTARFLLGYFLAARGEPEALEHYLAAARLSPGLAFAHYDLGRLAGAVALRTGQAARVEPLLREALSIRSGDPVLQSMLGSSLYAQKKYAEAEELLSRAVDRSPDDRPAVTNLAYTYLDTGRPSRAVPLFERAAALAPDSESVAYGLALALESSGERARAADAWRRFLGAFPSSPWAPRARARLASLGGR